MPISLFMSIPPARRYLPDSPMSRGKSITPDSRVHRHACLENKPKPIWIAHGRYKMQSFVCMSKLVEWRNFVHNNKVEFLFVTNLSLLPFLILN